MDQELGVEKAILGFGKPGTFFAPDVVENMADLKANYPA